MDGNSPGGGGGGGNEPDPTGSDGSYECVTYIVITTWYSQTCSASDCDEPVAIAQEQSTVTECGWSNGSDVAGADDDCEPEEGEIPIIEPEIPPDCESFKFVKTTTDAYWQEAAVKGIYFEVYILEPGATRRKYVKITYEQPIWFGMPTKTFDGTLISPGKAANVSANILNAAMSQTAHYFRGVRSSRTDVRNYFQRTLKSIMPFGGKANFNFTGSYLVTPSQYQVRYFGTGDCD